MSPRLRAFVNEFDTYSVIIFQKRFPYMVGSLSAGLVRIINTEYAENAHTHTHAYRKYNYTTGLVYIMRDIYNS